MKINKNIIKELTEYLNEFNLTEIEYTEKDIKDSINGSKTLKKAFKNPFIAALIGAASVGVLIIFIFLNILTF